MDTELYDAILAHYMQQAGSDFLKYVLKLKWQIVEQMEVQTV